MTSRLKNRHTLEKRLRCSDSRLSLEVWLRGRTLEQAWQDSRSLAIVSRISVGMIGHPGWASAHAVIMAAVTCVKHCLQDPAVSSRLSGHTVRTAVAVLGRYPLERCPDDHIDNICLAGEALLHTATWSNLFGDHWQAQLTEAVYFFTYGARMAVGHDCPAMQALPNLAFEDCLVTNGLFRLAKCCRRDELVEIWRAALRKWSGL